VSRLGSVTRFKEFLRTKDTLWIEADGEVIYRSCEQGITPLVRYLGEFESPPEGGVVYDKVVGNGAALLLKLACCGEVYGAVGSQLAAVMLDELGISYHFLKFVPYILNRTGEQMCPFEKLSLGKSGEEFYELAKQALSIEGADRA